MNELYREPTMNVKTNIIAGPNSGDYWNHSPGLEKPLVREEGPFPVQGNIGFLLAAENCNSNLPLISGSPNCTNTFRSDVYTTKNTCGEECNLKYPESFGDQNFGIEKNTITNSHSLHAYKNVRASTEGRGPSDVYGCYEWIPRLTPTKDNSCELNQYKAFQTVGDWQKLPENSKIVGYNFKM